MSDAIPSDELSREKHIFFQALDLDVQADRDAFLSSACGDDPALHRRIQGLLESAEQTDNPFDPIVIGELNDELDSLAQELTEEVKLLGEIGHVVHEVGDDYELIEEIGRGLMAVVFRAWQKSLQREVAVKILLGSMVVSPDARARFLAEAEAAAGLNHPHIVPIYEIGRHRSHDFYSMALIRGGTLADVIRDNRFDRRWAVRLILKVTQAVWYAHQAGVIHRDLKPENILMDGTEQPHVSDFGLACRLDGQTSQLLTGSIQGTPQYMAPEQAEPGGQPLTTAVDLYSLGVILYEMITGVPPLKADSTIRTLKLVSQEQPVAPRKRDESIDPDLETITMKCLEKDPARRYASAIALADDLTAWLDNRPIAARPPGQIERLARWAKRHPARLTFALMALLLALIIGIGGPITAWHQALLRQAADAATGRAELARQTAEAARDQADQLRLAAEAAKAQADQIAEKNRRIAYAYSNQLATAIAGNESFSLLSHAILRAQEPLDGEQDLRGWEWYYNYAFTYTKPLSFPGQGAIQNVSFSPSGRQLAVTHQGRGGSIIRNGMYNAMIRDLPDPTGPHRQVLWHEDDRRVATLSEQGTIRFWDTRNGKELAQFTPSARAIAMSWQTSEGRLLCLTDDDVFNWWDVRDLEDIKALAAVPSGIEGLTYAALSPDGRYLAGITDSKLLYIWTTDRPDQEPRVLEGHKDTITGLRWHSSSRWLATRALDGQLRAWEADSGTRIVRAHNLPNHKGVVTAMAWEPHGFRMIYAQDEAVSLHMCDLPRSFQSPEVWFQDSRGPVTAMDWSMMTHTVAVGFDDGTIQLRRAGLPEAKQTHRSSSQIQHIAFSPDSRLIAVREQDGSIRVNAVDKGERIIPEDLQPIEGGNHFEWDPSAPHRLMVVSDGPAGSTIRLTNAIKTTRQVPDQTISLPGIHIKSTAMGADGKPTALLTTDGAIALWDLQARKQTRLLRQPDGVDPGRSTLSFSPDDRYLMATGEHHALGLWDTGRGKPVPIQWPDDLPPAKTHAWHPDGRHFATGCTDGSIAIWSTDPLRVTRRLQGRSDGAPLLAWHPKGDRLASTDRYNRVHLWAWETGESALTLKGNTKTITGLAWSRYGLRLATCNAGRYFTIWDASAGYLMNQIGPDPFRTFGVNDPNQADAPKPDATPR